MPSLIVGFLSGGINLLSGNYYSGTKSQIPTGGLQLRADKNNPGVIYFALSGGITIQSGAIQQSGGALSGLTDGLPIYAGDACFVPRIGLGLSGQMQLFVASDLNGSGTNRLYYDSF